MKWRHWAILIVLVLLNYIIFSTAFTQLARQRRPLPRPTRTLPPTFESLEPTTMAWIVLPTSTPIPTRSPSTPTPLAGSPVASALTSNGGITSTNQITLAVEITVTEAQPEAAAPAEATPEPTVQVTIHTIQNGETLGGIADDYDVTVEEIVAANNLPNPDQISVGQELAIPVPATAGIPATAVAAVQPTSPTATPTPIPLPTNTPKPKPPTATPKPKPPTATPVPVPSFQFTGQVLWEPLVAANCAGPAIAKQSIVRDAGGNPLNGARVEVDCYGNKWVSHPSGNPGEYDPGHYDFAFGQHTPQAWTCTARVVDLNGQPVDSSDVVTIQYDTNDCSPHGNGHQVATVNWTKHW